VASVLSQTDDDITAKLPSLVHRHLEKMNLAAILECLLKGNSIAARHLELRQAIAAGIAEQKKYISAQALSKLTFYDRIAHATR
jgi:hypothetical protein